MSNSVFEFKEFTIHQDKCAMKVGTDGVLLGAWISCPNHKKILDIGTGTGLIALMLAQKSIANIMAIDLDDEAVIQAKENVSISKFNNQIKVENDSFQNFYKKTSDKFDLIVTNPPYFLKSLKSNDEHRSLARHADALPFIELIKGVIHLLDFTGIFYIILPKKEAENFVYLADQQNLFLSKLLKVKSKESDVVEKRWMMQFGFDKKEIQEDVIAIEKNERHQYTEKYKELTQPYYLHF